MHFKSTIEACFFLIDQLTKMKAYYFTKYTEQSSFTDKHNLEMAHYLENAGIIHLKLLIENNNEEELTKQKLCDQLDKLIKVLGFSQLHHINQLKTLINDGEYTLGVSGTESLQSSVREVSALMIDNDEKNRRWVTAISSFRDEYLPQNQPRLTCELDFSLRTPDEVVNKYLKDALKELREDKAANKKNLIKKSKTVLKETKQVLKKNISPEDREALSLIVAKNMELVREPNQKNLDDYNQLSSRYSSRRSIPRIIFGSMLAVAGAATILLAGAAFFGSGSLSAAISAPAAVAGVGALALGLGALGMFSGRTKGFGKYPEKVCKKADELIEKVASLLPVPSF